MQVGVNSKLLYAAVFFLLLTPIVLGSDTGALSAIPAWAPPLLALIFFAIFFLGKQRIISIGVYPGSPNEGPGAGNPVDSSPLWIRFPITEKGEDILRTIRQAQEASDARVSQSSMGMGSPVVALSPAPEPEAPEVVSNPMAEATVDLEEAVEADG